MNSKNRAVRLLLVVFLLTFVVSITQGMAEQSSSTVEGLIRTGKEKAKQMGVNPIPVYADEKGKLVIVPGTSFSIRNGSWALVDGDMLN